MFSSDSFGIEQAWARDECESALLSLRRLINHSEDIEDENNLHKSIYHLISSLCSCQTSFDVHHLARRIAFTRHWKGRFDRHIAVDGELGDEY